VAVPRDVPDDERVPGKGDQRRRGAVLAHAARGQEDQRARPQEEDDAQALEGEDGPQRAVTADRDVYIWLGLTVGFTMSALLIMAVQSRSSAGRTRTIRDSTVAALTIDLTEVTHSARARGLCNAADLKAEHRKLPRLVWKKDGGDSSCVRTVAFIDNDNLSLLQDQGHWQRYKRTHY
jgi:hypothetical protein